MAAVAVSLLLMSSCGAQEADISYQINTTELKTHRLKVTATLAPDAFVGQAREVGLPVWTPGSYKVRDYSRFLNSVECLNANATIRKTAKNRWIVEGVSPTESIRLIYTVYGHELTVRTNYFTPELCLITGAGVFLAPAPVDSESLKEARCEVSLTDFSGDISTALKKQDTGTYSAENYDELLDCPILMGDLSTHSFDVKGVPHKLVQAGHWEYWNLDKSLKDTATLVETIQDFWGTVPYDEYIFQNLITDTRGGLEHRNSTVVMTNRFATRDREKYVGWLSLLSHEFFHTWNVKQLKPKSLGPFDYEQEVYTRSLWVAEGITSYYDDLLVRRAGLSTREEYLEALSGQLNKLYQTPGRLRISLADASFDAWIRLYQPTDDLHNSTISYYNKGAIVAWLLDTHIRKMTVGKKSLDDVMRAALAHFGSDGFTEEQFRELAIRESGVDLKPFFHKNLDLKSEVDITEALEYWNLEWKPKSEDSEPYLGLTVKDGPRAIVEKVFRDSPAADGGLAPGDELIAIDQVRFPADDPLSIIEHLGSNDGEFTFTIARLGRIQKKTVTLGESPHPKHELSLGKKSPETELLWTDWLGADRKDKN